MRQKKYFDTIEGSPKPLTAITTRRVRFEEVDSIGMVWHGRYPSYYEDGRIAFGDQYGLAYSSFIKHHVMAPIAQMHFDFKSPLRFDETISIETSLHWNEAMRLDFSYLVKNKNNKAAATGYTVQLLTEPNGDVLFAPPHWIIEFRDKWQAGYWARKQ